MDTVDKMRKKLEILFSLKRMERNIDHKNKHKNNEGG